MEAMNDTTRAPLTAQFPKARLDALFSRAQQHKQGVRLDSQPLEIEGLRMDAADSIFIARQLEEIRAGLYEVQYGKLKAQAKMPWNTSIDRGVEQFTVRAVDRAGQPVAMKGREDNIPSLKIAVKSATINFHSFGLGYDYSMQEAHAAAYAGLPLSANLAMYCRERQARFLDSLAFIGNATKGAEATDVQGLFNAAGTNAYTVTTTGSGGSTAFANKSTDNIILDLNGVINQVIVSTLEVEQPDTLALPVSTETFLAQLRVGDGTSATVLTFFKANNPDLDVYRSMYLETLGSGSTRRMVAYANDPTRFEVLVSVMFDQAAPQFNGYVVKTLTETRTAGVALYLPESVGTGDGI